MSVAVCDDGSYSAVSHCIAHLCVCVCSLIDPKAIGPI